MRFATFTYDGRVCTGLFCNGGYYELCTLSGEKNYCTLLDFIRDYESAPMPDFERSVKDAPQILPEQVKLLSPIPFPFRNIICLGKNYADHAQEMTPVLNDSAIPAAPVYFAKNAYPAMGDGDIIPLHADFTQQVDYEAELAVIIGKTLNRAAPSDVENAIFGYTILNDVTARDVQSRYGQWYYGKSLDGFCPMGPHIVTRDEVAYPVSLNIYCRVNGEIRQKSNTSLLIYDIPRIVSELSFGMVLYPGDIIATGTPGGVGHAGKPPVYLKKGDVVQCEIEGIGILTNIFE